ncbi:unnamed protein product [Brachionus calyciflorus]|uniref:Uncharacterized protein n=1 Tax=Brachionus calyciflorus TaxID=104777 RepID=A0A813PN36_9BILA|nr:unnamed protein product [Brachionus calyciflorus]
MSSCRCISVNSQVEYDFGSHTIYPSCILIEDINQDNKNELIIGTTNGEIFIYKGSLANPWLKSSKQIGSITCMAFDNITDPKSKVLIVHDALGYVHFFTISQVYSRRRYASDISAVKPNPSDLKWDFIQVYCAKLLINPKFLIVDDLYNNGIKRMIVGYSDRIIRVFKWVNIAFTNNQGVASNNNSFSTASANTNSKSSSNTLICNNYGYSVQESGKFILEQSWELDDQINSIQIYKDSSNIRHLLVTQPGSYVYVCKPIQASELLDESNSSSTSSLSDFIQKSLILSSNAKQKLNNQIEEFINFFSELNPTEIDKSTIQTFLVPNVNYNKSDQYGYLITMNGDVFFFKNTQKTAIWHLSINALVMKYYKVDINKDGNDELVIATPEGQVYVINCTGGCICFDLGEPIRIFHLGYYSSEIPTLNLVETGTSSEADLQQCNPNQAFDLALDSSPISSCKHDENQIVSSSNLLSFIYVSSITNKISLVQTDSIIAYSKLKTPTQLKYKCENIFSHRKNFSFKLNRLIDNQKCLDVKVIHDLLYSNF